MCILPLATVQPLHYIKCIGTAKGNPAHNPLEASMSYPLTLSWTETLKTGTLAGLKVQKSFGVLDNKRTAQIVERLKADPDCEDIAVSAR